MLNIVLSVTVMSLLVLPAIAQNVQDGPYVMYKGRKGSVNNITTEGNRKDSFLVSNKAKTTIKVEVAGHPEWKFSVPLQRKLTVQPVIWPAVDKMIVLSDIEGEFEVFRTLMIANRVMDEKYNWTFGKGHLVICGDLFDRGKEVPAYLWLLYSLEQKAKAKGGYVHVILGNHDIMNLSGDFRYVDAKYFNSAKAIGVDYKALYDAGTEIGQWLRSKNIIEKIGDKLFMHAGISSMINAKKLTLQQLNDTCRLYYDYSRENLPAEVQPLFGSDGPFWYRGYFMDPKATETQVDETLSLYDCKQIFVGHTIVPDIKTLYNGKVVAVDVNHHEGSYQALLIEKGKYYLIDQKGEKISL